MTIEELYPGGSEIPPVPDESWWESILEEGEQAQAQLQEPSSERGESHSVNNPCGSEEDWHWASSLYEIDEIVTLPIIGFNRGGLLVEARNLRGFVPISHLIETQNIEDPDSRSEILSGLVGDTICLKVIELDRERGRLVLSARAALAGPGKRTALLSNLEVGMIVRGVVTNITRFGAFVDLGGLEGLIHVSELSWGRVGHPEDVVSCGQELEVKVLSIDQAQGRVALSLKELMPDPWKDVEQKYQIGDIVEGDVTNVVRFGAFVGIDEGLEGLIHISELGEGSFLHPRSVIHEGERVKVRIIHIDATDRRLGLSLRQLSTPTSEGDPEPKTIAEETEVIAPF